MKCLKYGILVFFLSFTSCSKEGTNGEDGAIGLQGEQGIDGQNGTDGNANVQIFDFDTSTETNSIVQLFMPDILTTEFLENHAFLVYAIKNDIHYHMPGPILGSAFVESSSTITRVITREGQIIISFFDWEGKKVTIQERVGWPIEKIRVVFIEATSINSVTGKGNSLTKQLKLELAASGVDTNDYYQVCEHYGICEN